jgi:hypothetical protein
MIGVSLQRVVRAVGFVLVAAMSGLVVPSAAHAYWYNGVWIQPGPAPYPYYRPPPPSPYPAYYAPAPRQGEWVPEHSNGYRWVPGHWRRY